MKKRIFSLFSFACLFVFLLMLAILLSVNSMGGFGPYFIFIQCLIPLFGMVLALFGEKSFVKPIGFLSNGIAFAFILFILVFGMRFGEV